MIPVRYELNLCFHFVVETLHDSCEVRTESRFHCVVKPTFHIHMAWFLASNKQRHDVSAPRNGSRTEVACCLQLQYYDHWDAAQCFKYLECNVFSESYM
jgi:hypothetical protein